MTSIVNRDEVSLNAILQKVITLFDAEVANVQNEEPCAGKPHAGICAGGAR